jgi:hypothetical protein
MEVNGGNLRDDGGGESHDQEMAKPLECENGATRRLQMEVSMDNRYGATEAGRVGEWVAPTGRGWAGGACGTVWS